MPGIGKGTELWRGDGGDPETFSKVAKITNVPPPPESFEMKDSSNQDTADGTRDRIPGLAAEQDIQVTMIYDPNDATQDEITGVRKDHRDKVKRNWEVRLTQFQNKKSSFAAYVSALDTPHTIGEVVEQNMTLSVTGAITWS